MSLKRRVSNLEKKAGHYTAGTHILRWDEPGPLTSLESGGNVWTRQPDEDEDAFITRATVAVGDVRFFWGITA